MEEGKEGKLPSNYQKYTCTAWPDENLLGSVSVPKARQWHGMAFNNFSQWHRLIKILTPPSVDGRFEIWLQSLSLRFWGTSVCCCGIVWSGRKVNTLYLGSEILRSPREVGGKIQLSIGSVTASVVTAFSHTGQTGSSRQEDRISISRRTNSGL